MPAKLSGGEAQRVAIARALANRPRIILADEPTAALDSKRAGIVMDLLRKLAVDQNAAIIAVTHDEKIFDRFDDMFLLRDGRLEGEVSAVDNRIDPTSRTLQVEAQIPNDDGKLKPGMSFSVSMTFPGESFPSVDPLAIQWSSEGAYLWKYADKKVERVPVQNIQRTSDGVVVKAELTEGDQVVTQGVQQLAPGATGRLLDELADTGGDGQRGGGGSRKGGEQPASAL